MRSHKLLAFLLCLITGPALAGYMTLLGSGIGNGPVAQPNFTQPAYASNLAALNTVATFTRSDATPIATYFDSAGLIKTVTSATDPRFGYVYNGSAWVAGGLMVEPFAATNSAPYSSALNNWTPSNGTVTNNSGATLDPAGTNTATLINPTGGSITNVAPPAFTAAGSTTYTASAYLKNAGGAGIAAVGFYDATNSLLYIARFDLSTGANTSVTAGVTALPSVNIGNGWWRVSAKWTSAANTASIIPAIYPYGTGGANPTSADKIYYWGPQWEAGGYASSYIANPSTGTTTRAAETVQFTGPALAAVTGPSASIIFEGSADYIDTNGIVFIGAQAAFSIPLYATSASSAVAYDAGNARLVGPASSGSGTWSTTGRAGIALSPSGTGIAMGGGTVVTTGTPFGAGAISSLYLGRTSSTTYANTYRYRSIGLYNQRIQDTTLQTKTTVGASY